MLRSLQHPHLRPYLTAFKITTTSTPSISVDVGAGDVTASARNSAGKSTLTPYRAAIRAGVVCATPGADIADGGIGTYDTDPSGTAIVSEFLGASGSGDDGTGYVMALNYLNEYTDRVSPQQSVKHSAINGRLMGFRVSLAGAAAVGSSQASSVGVAASVYTVTYNRAYGRGSIVLATPIAAAQKAVKVTAASATACSVATFDSSEAAEDNAFYLMVLGWDAHHESWGLDRTLQVPQLRPRLEAFRVSGSGTAAIALGTDDATLVDNGTGDYTLTWAKAFEREPIVIATAKAGRAQLAAAASSTAANILTFNAAGSAADDDFCLFVLGYDSVTEI